MKAQRQEAILRLVRDGRVTSQRELAEKLSRQGYAVSQTTISRDLRELGLARGRDSRGALRYGPVETFVKTGPQDANLKRMAPQFLLSVEESGNLVVVRTAPGNAQGLAAAIDGAGIQGIAGTVGGDDTIIVVCSNNESSGEIKKKLMGYALDRE